MSFTTGGGNPYFAKGFLKCLKKLLIAAIRQNVCTEVLQDAYDLHQTKIIKGYDEALRSISIGPLRAIPT